MYHLLLKVFLKSIKETLTVHKQEPPGEKPQKLKSLHIGAGLVARFQSKGCGDLRQQ